LEEKELLTLFKKGNELAAFLENVLNILKEKEMLF
jgi:hypothetical protein